MTDLTAELLHEALEPIRRDTETMKIQISYLRDIDRKIDLIREDIADLKSRVTSLEAHFAVLSGQIAIISSRLDRVENRLDRIERRLETPQAEHG